MGERFMTQESRLAIVIDSRQAKPTAEELAKALDAVDAAGVRVTTSSQRAGRSVSDAGRAYSQTGKEANVGASGVDRVNRSMRETESSAAAAAASIRRHLITAVGGLSAMKVIDMADDWGQMASRIRMATESSAEYERVQARMIQSANATYRNINETREAFIQLSPVLRQMGMTLDESMDAIDAFSGLMVTNAASTDRGAAAMRALSVSLQKGKMDADQWISVYSVLDSIVDTLAAHSGMAAEEIRRLGASGQLSVKMIAEALAGQVQPIMAQVEEMPTTVRDAMQKVGNEFVEYIGKANEVNGVTATMADGVAFLGENLGTVLNAGAVAGAGALAIFTSRMIGSTAATVADTLAKRAAAAHELDLARAQQVQATASLAQARALGTVTANMAQQTAAAAALERANQRLVAAQAGFGNAGRSLLGILGGPVGLLATVGLTAAAFVAMDGASDRAKVSIDQLTGSADEASEAFAKLGTLSRQAALDSLGSLHAEQARQASKAWHDFINDLEPTTARGAKAVAQMRSEMQAEVQAIAADTSLSTVELEQSLSSLIDRWVEQGKITEEQAKAYRTTAAAATGLTGTMNDTGRRMGELSEQARILEEATRGAAAGFNGLNAAMGFTEAGEKYLAQIQGRIKALQDGGDPVKAATRWINEHADASEADKTAIMSAALAEKALQDARERATRTTKTATNAINEAKKAAEAFERERRQYLNGLYGEVSALGEQARGLEQQIDLYGLAESATYDYAIAQLEQEKAAIAVMDAGAEEIAILERKIELLQQMKGSQQTLERLDAEKAAWESWSRDVEQIFQQVGQSLTDAIFEGGKSGRDLIKDLFKTLTLRVLIQPVMSGLQGLFMGAGPAGIANAGGAAGSMMGSPTSLFSMFGGNSMGMGISNAMSSLSTSSMLQGTGVGNWLMGKAGNVAGMSNLALGGAGLLGGIGASLLFGGKGHSGTLGGLGATAGMALGGPVGAVAGSLIGGGIGSLFGDREPTTRREQRTQVEFAGGLFDVTKRDDRAPAGADAAARALAEQAVSTANDIFKQVGVDAAVDSFHAIMASSYKGDRDGVASGGRLRIGDEYRQFGIANEGNPTISGFGGWSDADTLPRLATDIQLSIIEALQQAGVMSHRLSGIDVRGLDAAGAEQLAATIQQVVQEIGALEQAVAQLPFANLRDLSFEAYDGLLMLSGGLDSLIAAEQSYLQNFYSEAERTQLTWDAISRTLGEVNIAVPETRAEFRAIKESLDLNTESGRQAYAAIMSVQDAFASVTLSADELAEASKRAAEEDARIAKQRRDDALAHLSEAYNAMVQAGQREIAKLQESFSSTDSAMNAYRSKVQEYINSFNGLFSAIDQGVKALRGTGAAFQADYNRARAVISTTLLTGQLPQTADLSDALRIAQQGVTGQVYGSRFEQEKAYATLANEMEALRGIAEPELDAAQATLDQLEDQYRLLRGMSRVGEDSLESLEAQLRTALSTEEVARSQITLVESQLETARLQYNALAGIDDTLTKGFADLVAAFQKAAAAVPPSVGGGGGGSGGGTGNAIGAGSDYQRAVEYYRNNPDVANAFNTVPGATFVEFAKEHYEKYGKAEGRNSFAVGTSYVPYDMTANIHRGEIIIDPRSSDVLRQYGINVRAQGGTSEAEQRRTNQILERMDRRIATVERSTSQLAEQFDNVTAGGNAMGSEILNKVEVMA